MTSLGFLSERNLTKQFLTPSKNNKEEDSFNNVVSNKSIFKNIYAWVIFLILVFFSIILI